MESAHGNGLVAAAVVLALSVAVVAGFALVLGGALATMIGRRQTVDGSIPLVATAITLTGGGLMLFAAIGLVALALLAR